MALVWTFADSIREILNRVDSSQFPFVVNWRCIPYNEKAALIGVASCRPRRGAGVAEQGCLLSSCSGKTRAGGSNPPLSASQSADLSLRPPTRQLAIPSKNCRNLRSRPWGRPCVLPSPRRQSMQGGSQTLPSPKKRCGACSNGSEICRINADGGVVQLTNNVAHSGTPSFSPEPERSRSIDRGIPNNCDDVC
jgi:hypothetical protein